MVALLFLKVGGSTVLNTACATCCRISVIAVFAVLVNDCGDILLLSSCASDLRMVGLILASFLASPNVSASLVCGSFKRLEW